MSNAFDSMTRRRLAYGLLLPLLLCAGCSRSTQKGRQAEHGAEGKGEHEGDTHDDHGQDGDKHEGDRHGRDKPDGDNHDDDVVELTPAALSRANIRTTPARLRDLPTVINTTGEVAFDQDRVAHVSPRIPGRVHRVRAKLGDNVKAGQALALIDSIELGRAKATYAQAKAQLALARQHLQREEQLLKEKIASAKEVLDARAAHHKATADYRAARQRLRLIGLSGIDRLKYDSKGAALFAVRSAIDGRIIKKHLTLGELVRPNVNLFTVADLTRVWVWIDVYERDLARVHLEDKVQVQVEAYPSRVFSGEVAYISDQVDRDTRAVRARLDVTNADGALKPGMFARVRLTDPHGQGGAGKRRQALAVPASAVQRQANEHIAFVKLGPRRFGRRDIALGVEADDHVEILSGIKEGEEVVIQGAFILKSELAKGSMGGHSH